MCVARNDPTKKSVFLTRNVSSVQNYQMYCFAIATGFIAGEGLGGIVTAILTIAGVSGATYGTTIGCPGGVYCG